MKVESLYQRLPVFAQNWACSVYGAYLAWTRYDATYRVLEAELIARDAWSQARMEELRWNVFQERNVWVVETLLFLRPLIFYHRLATQQQKV